MEGKSYKGIAKNEEGTLTHCVERESKILCPKNCSKRCDKSEKRKCKQFSENDRGKTFSSFWKMSWDEKKVYVCSHILKVHVKERKVNAENSRRKYSFEYYLTKDDHRYNVCKNMFLTTLGIGEKTIYSWIENSENGIPNRDRKTNQKEDEEQATRREFAKTYLQSLPKLPSHYCRSSSSKLYLEPVFTSFAELHRAVKDYCAEATQTAIERQLFKSIFDELNMSLYHPKKDQCDTCCGFETGNVPQDVYDVHISRKDSARNEKATDKEKALTDDTFRVITVDLQAVLLCPLLKASALYYKTKLCCHNFTVYDVSSKDVVCYMWHEADGEIVSSNFASCIVDYINQLPDNVQTVTIYSDGCTYQNRNVVLSNALLKIAFDKNITIIQKYLKKGHTQMEVDCVHSSIERRMRHKPIYVPQNYVDIFRDARLDQPYTVKYLSFDFFKDFTSIRYFSSIRPGLKTGDPVVTNIRVLKYTSDGDIQFKIMYEDDYSDLPRRAKISTPTDADIVEPLYNAQLPLKASKFKHLQELKSVIPRDFHAFFDNLPHELSS